MIDQLRQAHASELKIIDAEEQHGPSDLPKLFETRLAQNLRRFPFLQRRMNGSVLFVVVGQPGGEWEVDLRRPSNWLRSGDSGDWAIRLTILFRLLAEILTDPDGLETICFSYKLDPLFKVYTSVME